MAPPPESLLAEIAAKAQAIETSDAATAGPHWGALHKLLLKAKVDPKAIMRLVASRDLADLHRTLSLVRGEEPPATIDAPPAATRKAVDPAAMHHAMKIFRRRVKFAQLDAESKLGVGPMSGGANHRIQSMVPPREIPIEVWEALADAGKLRREGDGFYAIVDDNSDVHW